MGKSIADEAGSPSHPWRAVDTLGQMLRRGTITKEMHQAGEDFRRLFRRAQLDPLRAADLARDRVDGTKTDSSIASIAGAKDLVWKNIRAVGGINSPGGSCLWHVVGCEQSLKEWAIGTGWSGRPVHELTASGYLQAALGVLAKKA